MWLKYDEEKGMVCKWCVEDKQTLVVQTGFSLEAGNRRTPAATFGISAAYFC